MLFSFGVIIFKAVAFVPHGCLPKIIHKGVIINYKNFFSRDPKYQHQRAKTPERQVPLLSAWGPPMLLYLF
jgi:hypothetical protein